jgi:two-component system NtrC family sensor kinase
MPATRSNGSFLPSDEKAYDLSDPQPTPGVKTIRRILLLEDDLECIDLLNAFLTPQGFEIIHVTNGGEGLRKTMATDFDIIICDMMMPTFPADMFYMAVERIKPHLSQRFIFMTGNTGNPRYDGFVRKKRGFVLWKPFILSDMQIVVNHILNHNIEHAHCQGGVFAETWNRNQKL